MCDAPLIEIEAASVSYAGHPDALKQVSLGIDRGRFVALVGPSGSGKTTLLKTINRLHGVTGGRVLFEGRSVEETDAPRLRRRMGYVFQELGVFPHMSVGENIAITPRLLGWERPRVAARVDELLDLVELPRDYASRFPNALSGGQRQRVAIARALAAEPPVMLMDEPFGALDPATRDSLGAAYRAIHDRLGLTTIMVTHDIQEAALTADMIAVLMEGKLVAYDTPAALMSQDVAAEVGALFAAPMRQAQRFVALRDPGALGGPA